TLMALFNGKKWFIASQSFDTMFSTTMEINSKPQAWGNDQVNVYKLFTTPSTSLTKKVVSKLWAGNSILIEKTARVVYVETDDLGGTGVVIAGTIDSDKNAPVSFSLSQ